MPDTPQSAAVEAENVTEQSEAEKALATPKRPVLTLRKPRVVDFAAEKEAKWQAEIDACDGSADYPPRISPLLRRAPKIGELYWCNLPKDAMLPELWKKRSVLVISGGTINLYGTAVVIPTTSEDPGDDPHLLKLSLSLDSRTSYAICDKPMTVAVSRFCLPTGTVPRLREEETNEVIKALHKTIPMPR